tara:strand:+ start:6028 stop:6627 length:600 start_codon:yes stop_codon:yes gene_type:complete
MSPTTADRSDRASTAVISARSFAFTFDDDDDDGVSSTRTSFVVLDGLIGGSTLTELNTISHASTEANGNSISLLFRVRRRIFAQKSHARIRRSHNNTGPKEKEEEKTKVVSFFLCKRERDVQCFREEIVPLSKKTLKAFLDGVVSFPVRSFVRRKKKKKKNVVVVAVFFSLAQKREKRKTTSSVLLSSSLHTRDQTTDF